MYPILLRIGTFPVPTYGVISVVALFAVIAVIRHYARLEGRNPQKVADAVVLTIAVAFVGSRVLEIGIEWRRIIDDAHPVRLMLLSTGVMAGAIATGFPFGIFAFRRIRLPILQGLDLLALAATVAEGVGRWGCFFSGCCWGSPADVPWAVTFPEIARRIHGGLPGVPLHPVQVYSSLACVAIFFALAWLHRRRRFHGEIFAAFLVLYSGARFLLEYVRGDEERGFVLDGSLSTSQAWMLLFGAVGIATLVALGRRRRTSGRHEEHRPAEGRATRARTRHRSRRTSARAT